MNGGVVAGHGVELDISLGNPGHVHINVAGVMAGGVPNHKLRTSWCSELHR